MRFSVITVCYNDKTGLENTIKSVIKQTSSNFEYIIIDGASTDGSIDIIKKYRRHINYWISEPDNGVYSAMNKGIKVAKGEYTIFMNSGDIFYTNDVLEKIDALNIESDLAVGRANMIKNGKVISSVEPPQEIMLGFWIYHSVIHQAAFMRTSMLKEKLYDENLKIVSDWKYMFEEYITRQYTYTAIPITICCYDTSGISSNNERRIHERHKVLKELLPPMLYSEAIKYEGMKNIFLNSHIINSMNESLKHRTLLRFYNVVIPIVLRLFKLIKR